MRSSCDVAPVVPYYISIVFRSLPPLLLLALYVKHKLVPNVFLQIFALAHCVLMNVQTVMPRRSLAVQHAPVQVSIPSCMQH